MLNFRISSTVKRKNCLTLRVLHSAFDYDGYLEALSNQLSKITNSSFSVKSLHLIALKMITLACTTGAFVVRKRGARGTRERLARRARCSRFMLAHYKGACCAGYDHLSNQLSWRLGCLLTTARCLDCKTKKKA